MGNPKDDSTTWTEELILGSSSPSEVLTLLTTCLDPSEVVLSNCNSLRFKLKLTDLDMEQEFEVSTFLRMEPGAGGGVCTNFALRGVGRDNQFDLNPPRILNNFKMLLCTGAQWYPLRWWDIISQS